MRDPALVDLFGYRSTGSGMHVDEFNADTYSAYYSGVNLISCTLAVLGLAISNVTDKGETPATDSVVHEFFTHGPNPHMTPYQYLELSFTQAITWGNHYSWIERSDYKGGDQNENNGIPMALWPLAPDQIVPDYDGDGGIIYKFSAKFPGERSCTYKAKDIIHLTGYGFDGLCGRSVVRLAAESIGLGLAEERFGASFFGNNAVPGGVITHPAELSPIASDNIAEEFEKKVKGPMKARRVAVLDEGMKYTPIGIPPEDSQFLESRVFQVSEMARWLRIPLHMLYVMDSATNNNIEEQGLDFLTYTLMPWIERYTQEIKRKLFDASEWDRIALTFHTDKLIKMDSTTKWTIYSQARNMGVLTLNQICKKEGFPLLDKPYGDTHVIPSTMKTLEGNDPATPIDTAVLQSVTDYIRAFNGQLPKNTAKQVLNATMPGASEALITSLLESFQTLKLVSA